MISESKACFWLAQSLIGSVKLNKLFAIYSAAEVWEAFSEEPKLKDFFGDRYAALRKTHSIEYVDGALDRLKRQGIGVVTRAGKMPERLRQDEVSPPAVLYYRGDAALACTDCLAVVGTRRASRYGAEAVNALTPDLVRAGLTIVSGLATGIDGYALRAALDAGGRPISVLAAGLDKPTPAANVPLFEEIADKGLVISEYPPGTDANRFTFPERNRLISGLSIGVVVAEAPEKSGALITADYALEQGRELFAVPGPITSASAKGSNALLKEGAHLTLTAADILEQLGYGLPRPAESAALTRLDPELQEIAGLLRDGDMHFDALCARLAVKPYELSSRLTMLELTGIIEAKAANFYGLKQ